MMGETMTLGERFGAYAQYCIRDDFGPPEDGDRLIAYADACERLAKAAAEPYDHDDQQAYDAVCAEFDDALAAYREAVSRG